MLALSHVPADQNAVLVRPYDPAEAGSRGVIVAHADGEQLLLADLIEKPAPRQARRLEDQHGTSSLWLLEGRGRLNHRFVQLLRHTQQRPETEPKLSLVLREHARTEPVRLIVTHSRVVDLGAASRQPVCQQLT